jgi:FkbM family methyltransferase
LNNTFKSLRYVPTPLKKIAREPLFAIPWAIYVNLRFLINKPKYFGQLFEDEELSKWLPESKGTYIDIGAGYPIRGSNSYLFYKRGWSGLIIEPILTSIITFKLFRPRDKVLNSLVGEVTGKQVFFQLEPYEYSTTDSEIAKEMQRKPEVKLVRKNFINQIRLDSLQIEMNPMNPSFLSIDVEGADLQVLRSIDWAKTRPRVICVEEWADRVNPLVNVTSFLEGQGYSLEMNLSPSLIFVASEYVVSREIKKV